MTLRPLKYHERKLLKKANFINWKDRSKYDLYLLQKYRLKDSEELFKYKALIKEIHEVLKQLQSLSSNEEQEFKEKRLQLLVDKLYSMGVLDSTRYGDMEKKIGKLTVEDLVKRRLPVVMVRLGMSDNISMAMNLIQQGHVRVGPQMVTDPAMLITREMEDFITWTNSSKVKRTVMQFNEKLDDYDLFNC